MTNDENKLGSYLQVISDLQVKRTELVRQLEALDQTIQSLKLFGAIGSSANGASNKTSTSHPGLTIAEAAIRVLGTAGRPLSTVAVTEAIQQLGVPLTGQTPSNTVGVTLSREAAKPDSLIIKIGRGAWGIANDWPKPPADGLLTEENVG